MSDTKRISALCAFSELYSQLHLGADEQSLINGIHDVLSLVNDYDKLLVVRLLLGWRPQKSISQDQLHDWFLESVDLPDWLLKDAHVVSGDWVETLSLSWPSGTVEVIPKSISDWIGEIEKLVQLTELEQKSWFCETLDCLSYKERIVINRVLTGTLSKKLKRPILTKAISKFIGQPTFHVAHRFLDDQMLSSERFSEVFEVVHEFDVLSQPIDFHEVKMLEEIPDDLDLANTVCETNHEGIRTQMICRKGHLFLWNRQNELISDRLPELKDISKHHLDFVLDGVILFIADDRSRASELLEKRMSNKIISPKREKVPIVFIAQDIIELNGVFLGDRSLIDRKNELSNLVSHLNHESLLISNHRIVQSMDALEGARLEAHPNGLVLKNAHSKYGPQSRPWMMVCPERFSFKALLLYVSRTNGWASFGDNELTFGVWKNNEIVPVAKILCQLSTEDQKALSQFVKENTLDRFGPVRSVTASQVFILSFGAVYEAKRRKSGLLLKDLRLEKWCKDEPAENASQLTQLRHLL